MGVSHLYRVTDVPRHLISFVGKGLFLLVLWINHEWHTIRNIWIKKILSELKVRDTCWVEELRSQRSRHFSRLGKQKHTHSLNLLSVVLCKCNGLFSLVFIYTSKRDTPRWTSPDDINFPPVRGRYNVHRWWEESSCLCTNNSPVTHGPRYDPWFPRTGVFHLLLSTTHWTDSYIHF